MRNKLLSASVFSLLFLTIFFFSGCQQEVEDQGLPQQPGTPVDNEKVTASVSGIVVDENNVPIQGASVSGGGRVTTTDRFGAFRFNNILLAKNNGYVKVTMNGYFTGSRSFVTTAGRTHTVRIKLLRHTNAGTFAGNSGGSVNLGSGAKLVMPTSAVTDANGTAYTGTVNVAMTWIDPVSNELPYIMPGDLRGITTSGEERVLQTYGMIGVEMTGSSGQPLKIAAGKTAELSFPIPAAILANAPATIDLWHFDETAGRWKQEGQATKSGNFYIAQVSHFSFWNCDAPFPLVDVCMTLVNATNNQPLNNVQVRIKRNSAMLTYGYGRTDSLGNLCGKVPQNEPLTLEILDQCNNVAFSQNIGPFSANTSIGTINVTIPAANTLTITGTLISCSAANVMNGAAVVYTAGGHSYNASLVNGTFSVTIIRCSSAPLDFSVIGIDFTTLQQSVPFTGSAINGTVNTGNLNVCGTSAAEYVEYLVDGIPFAYVSPPQHVEVYDSASNPSAGFLVQAYEVIANNVESTHFKFLPTSQVPGTYPLSRLQFDAVINLNLSAPIILNTFVSANPMVNITTFGGMGGFIEGNFNEQMRSGTTGPIRNVTCNFRVRRQ